MVAIAGRPGRRLVTALLLAVGMSGCSGGGDVPTGGVAAPTDREPVAETGSPGREGSRPTEGETIEAAPIRPISVLGLADQDHSGDRLRLGAIREQTAAYTSYDVTYRSRSTTGPDQQGEESHTISGVLNVPTGRGPFPVVVLAHGYIDPAVYVRGQGMTRERAYLADRGYVALHVDYRNHAGSDDDPESEVRMRLGYVADVITAVQALRASRDVPVDDDRVALFGRSMGGGVVLKALTAEPGLVRAAASWASVSSLEADNYRRFMADDPEDDAIRRRHGTPSQNPRFWRETSSRPYVERITEPVLMVHGRFDETCPPSWASATQRALLAAGVDSRLEWYDDGHAFGPSFSDAMDRTIEFFDTRLG